MSILYHLCICGTHILIQLQRFQSTLTADSTNESSYKANIHNMRLRLQKFQKTNTGAKKTRQYPENYKGIKRVFHHQGPSFVLEAIKIKIVGNQYDNFRTDHFGIENTHEVIASK